MYLLTRYHRRGTILALLREKDNVKRSEGLLTQSFTRPMSVCVPSKKLQRKIRVVLSIRENRNKKNIKNKTYD